MGKGHYRYTIRDARTDEKLGSMLSKEGLSSVTPEMIRESFFIFQSSDLRIVKVNWVDYDEVELYVDITARDLPPQLNVWDSRSGERTEPSGSLKKIDKLALKEMFPNSDSKRIQITHVDLGEDNEVRVWVKARKS